MFIVRRHFRLIRSFEDIWFWPVTIRTYTTDFYLFQCTDTGVIVTHALYFYQPCQELDGSGLLDVSKTVML